MNRYEWSEWAKSVGFTLMIIVALLVMFLIFQTAGTWFGPIVGVAVGALFLSVVVGTAWYAAMRDADK